MVGQGHLTPRDVERLLIEYPTMLARLRDVPLAVSPVKVGGVHQRTSPQERHITRHANLVELVGKLERGMRRLRPKVRRALVLRYWQGYSVYMLSRRLRVSERSVRRLLRGGLAELADYLSGGVHGAAGDSTR